MSLRFITPNQHGVLDFTVAAALIGLPFVLGLGASSMLAFWLSIATGAAVIILSLMTDYRFGLLRVIPFKFHLLVVASLAQYSSWHQRFWDLLALTPSIIG